MPDAAIRNIRQSPGFQAQRARIVQILVDWKDPYSTGRTSNPDDDSEDSIAYIDQSAASSSHAWPINAEVRLRWDSHALQESRRIVQRQLNRMEVSRARYWLTLQSMFLRDDCGNADYEYLRGKVAEQQAALSRVRGRRAKGKKPQDRDLQIVRSRAWAARNLAEVDAAIDLLTERLIDTELHAEFPEYPRRKEGEKSWEDYQREFYAVFEEECGLLRPRFRRYRNKALKKTAERIGRSKTTVETAVRFAESGEDVLAS